MIRAFFENPRVRQITTILLMLGVFACIFPSEQTVLQWWAAQAHWIALAYLVLGLFFLTLDNKKLMMVSMGCSAAICFYEIEVLNKEIQYLIILFYL